MQIALNQLLTDLYNRSKSWCIDMYTNTMSPIQVSESKWISFSMGAIWTIACAAVAVVISICTGIIRLNTFLVSFNEFKATTLAYEQDAKSDRNKVDTQISNIIKWEGAADLRRGLILPVAINKETLELHDRTQAELNSDLVHTDPTKHGLMQPEVVVKAPQNLPDIKADSGDSH